MHYSTNIIEIALLVSVLQVKTSEPSITTSIKACQKHSFSGSSISEATTPNYVLGKSLDIAIRSEVNPWRGLTIVFVNTRGETNGLLTFQRGQEDDMGITLKYISMGKEQTNKISMDPSSIFPFQNWTLLNLQLEDCKLRLGIGDFAVIRFNDDEACAFHAVFIHVTQSQDAIIGFDCTKDSLVTSPSPRNHHDSTGIIVGLTVAVVVIVVMVGLGIFLVRKRKNKTSQPEVEEAQSPSTNREETVDLTGFNEKNEEKVCQESATLKKDSINNEELKPLMADNKEETVSNQQINAAQLGEDQLPEAKSSLQEKSQIHSRECDKPKENKLTNILKGTSSRNDEQERATSSNQDKNAAHNVSGDTSIKPGETTAPSPVSSQAKYIENAGNIEMSASSTTITQAKHCEHTKSIDMNKVSPVAEENSSEINASTNSVIFYAEGLTSKSSQSESSQNVTKQHQANPCKIIEKEEFSFKKLPQGKVKDTNARNVNKRDQTKHKLPVAKKKNVIELNKEKSNGTPDRKDEVKDLNTEKSNGAPDRKDEVKELNKEKSNGEPDRKDEVKELNADRKDEVKEFEQEKPKSQNVKERDKNTFGKRSSTEKQLNTLNKESTSTNAGYPHLSVNGGKNVPQETKNTMKNDTEAYHKQIPEDKTPPFAPQGQKEEENLDLPNFIKPHHHDILKTGIKNKSNDKLTMSVNIPKLQQLTSNYNPIQVPKVRDLGEVEILSTGQSKTIIADEIKYPALKDDDVDMDECKATAITSERINCETAHLTVGTGKRKRSSDNVMIPDEKYLSTDEEKMSPPKKKPRKNQMS